MSSRNIIESRLAIVKPFKHRIRLELYIHEPDFRQYIGDHDFQFIDEKFEENKMLKKKMLFHGLEYGQILIALLEKIDFIRDAEPDDVEPMIFELKEAMKKIPSQISPDEFDKERDFLQACHQLALDSIFNIKN